MAAGSSPFLPGAFSQHPMSVYLLWLLSNCGITGGGDIVPGGHWDASRLLRLPSSCPKGPDYNKPPLRRVPLRKRGKQDHAKQDITLSSKRIRYHLFLSQLWVIMVHEHGFRLPPNTLNHGSDSMRSYWLQNKQHKSRHLPSVFLGTLGRQVTAKWRKQLLSDNILDF